MAVADPQVWYYALLTNELCEIKTIFSNNDELRTESGMRLGLWILAMMACAPLPGHANDFPTQARVEYVLRCMDYHGERVYEVLYSCVCSIDRIAAEFSYEEYVKAEVLAQLRSTPGERGGVFRDPEGAAQLASKYLDVTEAAEESCFNSREPT
ncbi:hypothetical protein BH24PSE2_BH24PSE2_00130 [soil metagenome]